MINFDLINHFFIDVLYECGDVIMKSKPFVHTLKSSLKSFRCDSCFAKK